MKSLLFAVVAALSTSWAMAQQFHLDPAIGSHLLVVRSTEEISGGHIIVVGTASNRAVIARTTPLGALVWTKNCDLSSEFWSCAKTTDGNIVAVGVQYQTGVIAKFDTDGNVVWTKTVSTPDSTITLRSVVVVDDSIYVVGDKWKSSQRREVLIGLDQSGNIFLAKELQSSVNQIGARKIFHHNNHLFVLGDGRNGSIKAMAIAKYTLTGALVAYTTFGGFGPDDYFLDAAMYQGGTVMAYRNLNDMDKVLLVRVDENLGLVGSPTAVSSNFAGDNWAMTSARLGTSSVGELYLSGGMTGNSYNCVGLMKISSAFAPVWGQKNLFGKLPAETSVLELSSGDLLWSKTHNGTMLGSVAGARISTVSALSGSQTTSSYCESMTPFGFVLSPDMGPFPVTPQTRVANNLNLVEGVLGFSNATLVANPCGGLLPVEMLSFTGQQIDQTVGLRWATGSERNNSHFDVMRSRDGLEWKEIGRVVGNGNTVALSEYQFVDEHPFEGVSYYKLVQVDYDGQTDSSEMVAVEFTSKLVVYPNPLNRGEILRGMGTEPFQIFDGTGRVVWEAVGETEIDLPSGAYTLRTNSGLATRVIVN